MIPRLRVRRDELRGLCPGTVAQLEDVRGAALLVVPARSDQDPVALQSHVDSEHRVATRVQRSYSIAALDVATLRSAAVRVSPDAAEVSIRLAEHEAEEEMTVCLADRRGRPLNGLLVRPVFDPFPLRTGRPFPVGRATRTDAGGSVRLARGFDGRTLLRIEGSDVFPTDVPAAELRSAVAGSRAIVVPRRAQVRVLTDLDVDAVAFLDSTGRELPIDFFFDEGSANQTRAPVVNGKSAALTVGEHVAEVLLLRGELLVLRQAVRLEPGGLRTLRL